MDVPLCSSLIHGLGGEAVGCGAGADSSGCSLRVGKG